MQGIIFLSLECWDNIWRRNQFFVNELSRRQWGKIVYVVPQRDVTNAIRRREWRRLKRQATYSPDGLPDVHVVQPTKVLPNSFKIARRFYEATFRALVRRESAKVGLNKPILWINDHSGAHLVDKVDHGPVVYDITDDWTASGQSPAVLRQIVEQDRFLCQRADAVIVCSERLNALKQSMVSDRNRLHLIPNGVDLQHYVQPCQPASISREWEPPVFMYTGTLHPDRLDLQLIVNVARRMDRGTLAFVGPNYLPACDINLLNEQSRVRLIGPVAYAELPSWMAAATAFFVPHKITDFTESLNPIKLWEYLAAGKPIVSTNIAGFRDFPQVIRIEGEAEAFHRALVDSVPSNHDLMEKRRRIAGTHSWSVRVDQLERILNTLR